MNAYYVVVREPKTRCGEFVTKAVVVAEHTEEALRLAKKKFKTQGDASWSVTLITPGDFFIISRG